MIGAPVLAQWIAHIVFWALVGLGYFNDNLRVRWTVVFVGLWLIGYFGLPRFGTFGSLFITPYVGMLDVLLVLIVLRGDVRLS